MESASRIPRLLSAGATSGKQIPRSSKYWTRRTWLEADRDDPELVHHIGRIKEHGERALRVVFNKSLSPDRKPEAEAKALGTSDNLLPVALHLTSETPARRWLLELFTPVLVESRCLPLVAFTPSGPLVYAWETDCDRMGFAFSTRTCPDPKPTWANA